MHAWFLELAFSGKLICVTVCAYVCVRVCVCVCVCVRPQAIKLFM